MDREQIQNWLDKYNKEEDLNNVGIEKELGRKFKLEQKLTKEDLKKVIEWKFQGRLKGRQIRTLNLIKDVLDSTIQEVTEDALKSDSEELRLKLLMSFKGIKVALASVILTFYDSEKYCVFDIHIYDEIFKTDSKTRPRDLFSNPKYYLEVLKRVRILSKKTGFKVRDIEKALFKKNFEDSN